MRLLLLIPLLSLLAACAEPQAQSSIATPAATLNAQQQLEKTLIADDRVDLECYPGLKATITDDLVVLSVNRSDDKVQWTPRRTKACIFAAQRVAWNYKALSPSIVTVRIDCNLQDQYGKQFVGDCAKALLKKETAKRFVWGNLDGESAWGLYDERYMR